jgi:hypothetical protein
MEENTTNPEEETISIPVRVDADGKETEIRKLSLYKEIIDFDNPEEDLVFNLLFAREDGDTTTYNLTDVYTPEEILRMAASSAVDSWMPFHRQWLESEANLILKIFNSYRKL